MAFQEVTSWLQHSRGGMELQGSFLLLWGALGSAGTLTHAGILPAGERSWYVTVFTLASLLESPPRESLQTSCFTGNPCCKERFGNREGFPRRLKIRIWSWEGSGGFDLRDGWWGSSGGFLVVAKRLKNAVFLGNHGQEKHQDVFLGNLGKAEHRDMWMSMTQNCVSCEQWGKSFCILETTEWQPHPCDKLISAQS